MTDKDGYPTREELKFISNFDSTKKSVKELIDLIENIWWSPEFGFHLKKRRDDIKTVSRLYEKPKYHYHIHLELHTGGWSGNEDIIGALEKNKWFWFFYWESSRRGGHFTFVIPIISYERKEKK